MNDRDIWMARTFFSTWPLPMTRLDLFAWWSSLSQSSPCSRGGKMDSISRWEECEEFEVLTSSFKYCYLQSCLFPLFLFFLLLPYPQTLSFIVCLQRIQRFHTELPLSLYCARTLASLEGLLEARNMISTMGWVSTNNGQLSDDSQVCEIAWKQ